MTDASTPVRPGPANASVVDRLAAGGLDFTRVTLREPDAETPAGQALARARRAGRYRVVGKISSGGVGTILRASDPDLGRNVAIKTLHAKWSGSPTMVQRFVEEAQIGGQLQHPGIVPVYDLDTTSNGQPWFAMKLVKGQTFAALLSARRHLRKNLRRYLVTFEQVCQCVAYAHARGVIHRDLKPSNVMVGPFGEVQVLDWGFAKVLAQGGIADEKRARREAHDLTHIETVRSTGGGSSVAGSLMGTPAYMPPEQALGHVDRLDERADVFSLGSILCEILTGEPAFPEPDLKALLRSRRGDLAETFERIRGSGADDALQRLAMECLSPLRRDRPANAGAVARTLAGFLASAEERQRRARVAQVEARSEARKASLAARAAQQRKWQTVALAGAVLVSAAVGAWVFVTTSRDHAETRMLVADSTREALDEASRLERRELWPAALAEAERALHGATEAELPGLAERAREIAARVRAKQTEEEAARAKAAREADLRERLAAARSRYLWTENLSEAEPAYRDVFRNCGIDPTTDDPREAARALRADPLAAELRETLDDWAVSALQAGRPDHARLFSLARAADDDAWRARVRDTLASGSLGDLQSLADDERTLDEPASSLLLLARGLVHMGDEERAVTLLQRALPRHLSDYWFVRTLAELTRRNDDLRTALRCYTVARALRPEEPGIATTMHDLIGEMERRGDRKPR